MKHKSTAEIAEFAESGNEKNQAAETAEFAESGSDHQMRHDLGALCVLSGSK
jgi:hypothetical protein